MAGNKALEKFKESKIPKKGKGKITTEIPIYKEPNTQSEVIGKIRKNQEVSWISKSICDEREWIRCNKDNNYGYIVGYEKDGKCNLDIATIKEKNEDEIKIEYGFEKKNEITPITKEEINLGNEALEEILNEDDDKKDGDDDGESKTNKSTEIDESNKSYYSGFEEGKSKTGINIEEDDDWDDFFESDINKLDFIKSENEKLINEIKCQINNEKLNNSKSQKKTENENTVSKVISDLKKDSPDYEKSKIDILLENLNDDNNNKKIKRTEAFNFAKRNHGIPKNQEPDKVEYNVVGHQKNYNKKDNEKEGKIREYFFTDKNKPNRVVIIREDLGHKYPDDPSHNRGHHFNVEVHENGKTINDKKHYDFD